MLERCVIVHEQHLVVLNPVLVTQVFSKCGKKTALRGLLMEYLGKCYLMC